MLNVVRTSLVVGLLPMVALAGGKSSDTLVRLAKGQVAIANGQNQVALDHLTWCYDNAGTVKTETLRVRGYVIDSMGDLCKNFSPARNTLKAWRDTALTAIGTPPKIGPDLFDFVAINRALGDMKRNEQLFNQLRKSGYKQFSARPQAPSPPSSTCDICNARMQSTFSIQAAQDVTQAFETIGMSTEIAAFEQEELSVQVEELIADIADLQDSLAAASSEFEQARQLRKIRFLTSELNEHVRPALASRVTEVEYYESLREHVSRFSGSESTGK